MSRSVPALALLLTLFGCSSAEEAIGWSPTGAGGASFGGGIGRGGAGDGSSYGGSSGAASGGGLGFGGGSIDVPHTTQQVDVLFVVDNSPGMADKQQALAASVEELFHGLTQPHCIDANGERTGARASNGICSAGTPAFAPVRDIHFGLVTSSLGSHGGAAFCVASGQNDRGQLLPKVRDPDPRFPYATWNDSGFLSWNTDPTLGTNEGSEFVQNLKNMILSAGEDGCSFPAPLEAMYRFLIDPMPPVGVPIVTDATGQTRPTVPDDPEENPVLVQRQRFLRADSALLVVLLSDGNDCSVEDSGQGFLVTSRELSGTPFRLPPSTSVCEQNPNAACCSSCAASAVAEGCPEPSRDPACMRKQLSDLEDSPGLRCFDHKRRFGHEFLYPISRYVDGLSNRNIVDELGTVRQNPLFSAGARDPSMVFVSGIVGVPWQDLARASELKSGELLEYLSPKELESQARWPLILGDPGNDETAPTPPGDKLMFETPSDRTTLFGDVPHPLIGQAGALAPSSLVVTKPNVINGHESSINDNSSLQNACIMPLDADRFCEGPSCDCYQATLPLNLATCNGTAQTHSRARPSTRQLEFIQKLAATTGNASPASACWKQLAVPSQTSVEDDAYRPALQSLSRAIVPALAKPVTIQ